MPFLAAAKQVDEAVDIGFDIFNKGSVFFSKLENVAD